MRWAGRSRVALAVTAAIAAFTASACFGGPPPEEPPPPSECQGSSSASASSSESAPIPPDQAREEARAAASQSSERTADGRIPLVTVEQGPGGAAEASQTPVSSPDEAGAVAEQKASDGDVVAVEVDKPVHSDTATDPRRNEQWALDRVNFEGAWLTTNGTGETVAVVDTGVQQSHVDLSGQVQNGQYFLHDPNGNALEGPGGTTDDNSHGTHVAGIITAVADNAPVPLGIGGAARCLNILPVKVLDSNGNGFASDVTNGITWAANHNANVINLSLGGGPSSSEQTAIQYAR